MPTKLNSSGQQQNYDKSTGRYAKMSVDNVARVLNGDKPIETKNIRPYYREYIDKKFAELDEQDIEYLNEQKNSASTLFDELKDYIGDTSRLTEDEVDYFREKLKEYGVNDEYSKEAVLENNKKVYDAFRESFENKGQERELKELEKFYKIATEKGWRISESPYSTSVYALSPYDQITWGYKPEGSLRFGNHWNFVSRGELHEETDDSFLSNGYKTGVYESGRYVNTGGKTWFSQEDVNEDDIYDNPDIQDWFTDMYGEDIEDMRNYRASKLASEYIDYNGANYIKTIDVDGNKEETENIGKIGNKYYIFNIKTDRYDTQIDDAMEITDFDEVINK